jgi:hypothetical protein
MTTTVQYNYQSKWYKLKYLIISAYFSEKKAMKLRQHSFYLFNKCLVCHKSQQKLAGQNYNLCHCVRDTSKSTRPPIGIKFQSV